MPDILDEFEGFEGDEVINENRHHLEPEELNAIFEVLKTKSPFFWHPFYFIMYTFGCRVSEVRIIKKEAISYERKEIVIYRLKKRQWDREYFKSKADCENFIKTKFPKATTTPPEIDDPTSEADEENEVESSGVDLWYDDESEIARISKHAKKDGYNLKIRNGSKGFKRFLYKIDDQLMGVLDKIRVYHETKNLIHNRFLFPAMRKRKEADGSARMVKIGRLRGDHAISRTVCWRAFKDACEMAGTPESLRNDHCLRHSRATLLLADGVPEEQVQYLLGHENIATTRRYLGLANALRAKYQNLGNNDFTKQLAGV